MALTNEEKQIVEFGQNQGKSPTEIMDALNGYRQEQKKQEEEKGFPSIFRFIGTPGSIPEPGKLTETFEDIGEGVRGVAGEFKEAGEEIVDIATDEDRSLIEKAVNIGGSAFRGGSRAFGEGLLTLGKIALGQETEEKISEGVGQVAQMIGSNEFVQDLVQRYNQLDPAVKRNIDSALGYAEGLADIATARGVSKAVRGGVELAGEAVETAGKRLSGLFEAPVKSVDDLIKQADTAIQKTPTAIAREAAEEAAPRISLSENWVNITPDIKKRVAGKQDLMQEYFDVTHTRNLEDTAPSVFEYGGNQARNAADKMNRIINETGGEIGATRKRLGTIEAPINSINEIENTISNQLKNLNLQVVKGEVKQIPGTVTKVGANADITALNELYKEFLKVKQSPTLTNLIDLRGLFDKKISFGKTAREVSNSVDPISRQVRKEIADTAADIVGPTEAKQLEKYSQFMDAYTDLTSFTDRRAGGEYLLRLVLSGRGGEARQIIQTIKEFTGIDLMDHATMMTIAADLIGNSRQQNLFRQEITKAGLDVASFLKGGGIGAAETLFQKGLDSLLDPEKIFLKAAK